MRSFAEDCCREQLSPHRQLAVAGLSLGTSLNPLNSSMIAVALVVLREDFRLDVATVTWVITAFYITSAAGQPLMGRLADRFGPRKLFMLGMALVAVTCALAPFSPNFVFVCIARALMALGTATAYPSAVVMVGELAKRSDSADHPSLWAGSRWPTRPGRRSARWWAGCS
jgi:MFS family permease